MTQLQAGQVYEKDYATVSESFSFDKAVWRERRALLVLKGSGTPGSKVEAFIAGTNTYLGTKTVNRRGYWRFKFYNPAAIPCSVSVDSGDLVVQKDVTRAPADCISGSEPPVEETPPEVVEEPETPPEVVEEPETPPEIVEQPEPPVEEPEPVVENSAPVIYGSPSTSVAEGAGYRFTPQASDADGDSLTFSIVNAPSWASFNTSTGVLSGTPGFDTAGTTSNIQISVTDGSAVASLNAFSITVSNTNRAPSIDGSPATNTDEGSAYSFTPSAYDPDGDDLRFSIENQPHWANFNPNTGNLSGTPDSDSAGSYPNIVISVSDGSDRVSLNGFTVTINDVPEPNTAPVISGTAAASVIAGNQYWFAPSASDADNDTLSFSVSNLPNWASFNADTGVLNGSPSSEDVGVYNSIVITVTDGTATASLSPLSITVVEPEPTIGDVALGWVPPSTRTDGSALDLSEIAGYKIYMGTTADNLEQIVDLADSTIQDYVVENLDVGDYYFAVTTYDMDGNESGFSNIAMKSTM
ncbi:MAG: putative Ig domain-containing protein [Candidatus Thiodiazotropha sp.]